MYFICSKGCIILLSVCLSVHPSMTFLLQNNIFSTNKEFFKLLVINHSTFRWLVTRFSRSLAQMSRSAREGGVVECVCTVHSSVRSFLCPDYCVFLILYNIDASTFLYIHVLTHCWLCACWFYLGQVLFPSKSPQAVLFYGSLLKICELTVILIHIWIVFSSLNVLPVYPSFLLDYGPWFFSSLYQICPYYTKG